MLPVHDRRDMAGPFLSLSTLILLNAIEGGDWRCRLTRSVGRNGRGDIVLKAGQILYDNDPRYRGRKLEVVRVEGSYAVCMCGPRQVKVRLDYIFSDGKPRRSGYSIVAEEVSSRSSTSFTQP
jgi:hypothetical protein